MNNNQQKRMWWKKKNKDITNKIFVMFLFVLFIKHHFLTPYRTAEFQEMMLIAFVVSALD
jgi:hypothetical protein